MGFGFWFWGWQRRPGRRGHAPGYVVLKVIVLIFIVRSMLSLCSQDDDFLCCSGPDARRLPLRPRGFRLERGSHCQASAMAMNFGRGNCYFPSGFPLYIKGRIPELPPRAGGRSLAVPSLVCSCPCRWACSMLANVIILSSSPAILN